MSERMTDERLAEIENGWHWEITDAANELLQALKAEREYAANLEAANERLQTAINSLSPKDKTAISAGAPKVAK